METIAEFSAHELWIVESALHQRYGHHVELGMGDVDLSLTGNEGELTPCPAVVWEERGAGFVVCKTGENRYRGRFYYAEEGQYATGRDEYDDIKECVITLLRAQADHEKERQGVSSGKTAQDLNKAES